MTLPAGKLRHRVRIEEYVTTQDANGDLVSCWLTFADGVAAAIEPLSAREAVQAQSMQSEVSARIVMRWRAGLKASMRIVHGETIYRMHGTLGDKDSGREYVTVPASVVDD